MIAGDVVLLRFPFSDLSGSKLRPAIALAVLDRGDFIACQITSKRDLARERIALTDAGFSEGGLHLESYVLPGKLFTAHSKLVAKRVGRVNETVRENIRDAVIKVIRGG
jgi:mRNA interferase MazF